MSTPKVKLLLLISLRDEVDYRATNALDISVVELALY
jgi:hypothetical protein